MSGNSTTGMPIKTGDPEDRRAYVRWRFKGTAFAARIGKKKFQIRLKDLSRGGACGMMEEPVAVGDFITIEFDEFHQIEGQVRWVRRTMAGLEFNNPLANTFVLHVHETAHEKPPAEPADDYLIAPRPRKAARPKSRPAVPKSSGRAVAYNHPSA